MNVDSSTEDTNNNNNRNDKQQQGSFPLEFYPHSNTWKWHVPTPTPIPGQSNEVDPPITYYYDFTAFRWDPQMKKYINHFYEQQGANSDVYLFKPDKSTISLVPKLNSVPYPDGTAYEKAIAQQQFVTHDWCISYGINDLHEIDQHNPSWKTTMVFGVHTRIPSQMGWSYIKNHNDTTVTPTPPSSPTKK